VYDKSLDGDALSGTAFDGYASMRSGERGYWNQFTPQLDYSSLTAYTDSVMRYVEKGVLFSAGELYLPVRIKPRGENSLAALRKNGADHIELRMFDLNPLEGLGINKTDLEFAYLFLTYLTSLDDFEFTAQMQSRAIENHKSAAKYDAANSYIDGVSVYEAAELILDDMAEFFDESDKAREVIEYENEKIYGGRICETVKDSVTRDYGRDVRLFFYADRKESE
jgi:glutamate--cysteine ligase